MFRAFFRKHRPRAILLTIRLQPQPIIWRLSALDCAVTGKLSSQARAFFVFRHCIHISHAFRDEDAAADFDSSANSASPTIVFNIYHDSLQSPPHLLGVCGAPLHRILSDWRKARRFEQAHRCSRVISDYVPQCWRGAAQSILLACKIFE